MSVTEEQKEAFGAEWYAGTLRGLRSFAFQAPCHHVNRSCTCPPSAFQLTGRVFHNPWTPGENIATCATIPGLLYMLRPEKSLHKADPSTPLLDCTCGFYAYFDRDDFNKSSDPNLVWMDLSLDKFPYGIIEGYGKIIMGTLGFRAAKARIKALIAPDHMKDRIMHRYPTLEFFDSLEEAKKAYPVMTPEQAEGML